jgi:hypothetical protein
MTIISQTFALVIGGGTHDHDNRIGPGTGAMHPSRLGGARQMSGSPYLEGLDQETKVRCTSQPIQMHMQ